MKEKKDFVPSHNNYVEPCNLLNEFPQSIVYCIASNYSRSHINAGSQLVAWV